MVEDVGQELPKLQGKIHSQKGGINRIADELVSRGVCRWIPRSSVVKFRGNHVLNGLFGVPKSSCIDGGLTVLRLIMNLVPSNAIMKQIRGNVRNFPHMTGWLSTFVEQGSELRLWQSDMSNAFYLFKLPDVWGPYLTFNVLRESKDFDDLADGGRGSLLGVSSASYGLVELSWNHAGSVGADPLAIWIAK